MLGIQAKEAVRWYGRHGEPEVWCLLQAFYNTAPPLVDDVLVVTSANDGIHGKASQGTVGARERSAHYRDEAWDIRTHPLPDGKPRPGAVVAENEMSRRSRISKWIDDAKLELDRLTHGRADRYYIDAHGRHIHAQIRKSFSGWSDRGES